MKTSPHVHNKTLCMAILILAVGSVAWAYPPNNAAVLYCRAHSAMDYPEKGLRDALSEYCKGRTPCDGTIKQLLLDNRLVIDFFSEASKIEYCDWGVDDSKGIDTEMPDYSLGR